jgi:hypothetical protein
MLSDRVQDRFSPLVAEQSQPGAEVMLMAEKAAGSNRSVMVTAEPSVGALPTFPTERVKSTSTPTIGTAWLFDF